MAGVVLWVVRRDCRSENLAMWSSVLRRVRSGRKHERGLAGVEDGWAAVVYLRRMLVRGR